MENLNRTLTGIARIYEMQLKSASQQINTQDEINEQTRKMAAQIAELNSIYARMIDAMKAGQSSWMKSEKWKVKSEKWKIALTQFLNEE